MKPIEELGISPAPWREASYGLIVSSDNKKVADFGNSMYDPKAQDFVIMVSAPEMYECLLEAIEDKCRKCKASWYGECVTADGKDCEMVAKWKSVLAKAAGEETS